MSRFKQLFKLQPKQTLSVDEYQRKHELIRTINFELFILGLFLIGLNLYMQFWVMSTLLIAGTIAAMINQILLKNNYNYLLCGHIINFFVLTIITLSNLWLGGISNSYIGWFYVLPIIAAATIGMEGLIAYGCVSAIIFTIFITGHLTPIYNIPEQYLDFLNTLNYIFIFSLIFTTLYHLLSENILYETLLREQNYLLNTEKQKFHYLSHHDSLTNLPNRPYFNFHLQNILDSTNTEINSVTLYFMDLDGFKKINDKYGHEIGDILLLQTSKRLKDCFRKNDFIARLGGDEFTAVIIHSPNDKIDEDLVKRIENEFVHPFTIKNMEIKCTISIGKADYPKDAQNAEVLLKMADDAMYKNKKSKYQISEQNQS